MLKKASLLTLVLVVTAAFLITAAFPVAAQQDSGPGRQIEVTGLVERPEATTCQHGTHATSDAASGERYALASEEAGLLDRSLDERVTN